jgi:cytochrome P450
MRLTLHVIGRTLFAADVGRDADAVAGALEVATNYFLSPYSPPPWLGWLPLPGVLRYRRAVRSLDRIVRGMIRRRREAGAGGDDLLARLLAARDEHGRPLSEQLVRDEMMTLFLAGHETTALALSYSFYLLAKHPAAEAELAAELDAVLGDDPPTAADVPRLRYTEWVVRESMRLYPPAWSLGREALADCEVGGFFVPKGTQLAPIQWVVHRDRRWFDDPETFRPERWDNDLARRLPRCAYFPFGDGPRVCIGERFAMLEAVLILATAAQRYRLSLPPGPPLRLVPSVTLRPKGGLRMVPQRRRPAPVNRLAAAAFSLAAARDGEAQ